MGTGGPDGADQYSDYTDTIRYDTIEELLDSKAEYTA